MIRRVTDLEPVNPGFARLDIPGGMPRPCQRLYDDAVEAKRFESRSAGVEVVEAPRLMGVLGCHLHRQPC